MILHNPQISGSLTFDGNGSIALPSSTTYTPGVVSGSDQIATTFAQTILDDTSAGAVRTTIGVDAAGTDNSTNVTLGNTNYLSISGQAITGGTVPIGSGGTGATSAGAARTALGVDAAGTVNYTLPTNLAGDDIDIDTTVLSGATVISDLDLNITTNTSGLVTDANGSIATRDLTPGDLGLGNVDNTADSAKPVSTAQQTALNLKANIASPTFTGTPISTTPSANDSSTKIATTAYVQQELTDLVGTAGSTLDTLGELSASLADDSGSLASLVTTVGTKLAKASNLSDLANVGTSRTNLGVDAAGTDNSTNVTLVTTSYDYLSISGQAITLGSITNADLAGSIAASKLAGSIGNSKLSNSSVSFGGVSVSLGGSDATPAFDLADATGYLTSNLSGTITNTQLAGSIANSKLANSSISIDGSAISLGGSVTTLQLGTSSTTALAGDTTTISGGQASAITANTNKVGYTDALVKTKLTAEDVVSGSAQIISLVGVDEDNFASNSATKFPSQQSVKAYVDAQVDTKDALSELSGDTDDVSEGSSNLYYTDARVKTKLTAEGVVSSSAQVQSLGGVNNSTITFTAGAGLDGGGAITLNQGSNETVTFNVADGVVSGSTQIDAQSASNPSAIYDNSGTPTLRSGITQAEVRTAIGTDVAGTDNSTNVTLAGSYDYLTLSGQAITLNQVDYSTDISNRPTITNATITLSAGTNLSGGGNFTTNQVGDETITINLDTDGSTILSGSVIDKLPSGTVSGSDQVASTFAQTILDDTSAGAVRTTIGVDASGTDNSTNVTLAGNDYLTISGQQITANSINNDDLTNSSITIDGSAVALGGSVTTLQLGTSGTTALAGNTTTISGGQASAITANTNKVGYTDALVKAKLTAEDVLSGSTHAGNQIFSNNVTIQGDLDVAGTTTFTTSNNVQIGDNILELNFGGSATTSGILVKDVTGGSSLSGSFLWDATNDFWKAGRFGNEQQIITKENDTDDLSEGSTNLYYTNARFNTSLSGKDTDDLNEGSVALYYTDTRVKTKLNTEGVVSGSITTQLPAGVVSGSEQVSYTSITNRPNIYRTIAVSGQSNIVSDGESDTLNFAEGGATTITTNASSDTITISSVNTEYSVGDGGLTQNNFTNTLKSKLDGIEASANVTDTGNVHPILDDKLVVSGSATQVRSFLNVENGADVTDTSNVTAAGALMDSEIDADLKTFALPANTTISAFGKTIVDDADAGAVRTTIGVDAAGTDNSTNVTLVTTSHDYLGISGQAITLGAINNNDLTNSAITIDGTSVSLGGSVTTANDNTQLTQEQVEDFVGGMLGGTETGITVTYQDSTGDIDFVVASQTANDFTNTLKSKLDGIEVSADVTDATNVEAAGALMDSEVTNLAQVKAFASSDYLASSTTTISGGQASAITTNTNKVGYTDALVEAKIHAEGVFSSSAQVSGITNTQLAGSIANSKLSNSSITINGSAVSLGGSVTTPNTNTQLSTEEVQDIVGGMVSSNTESGISVTYDDSGNSLDFSVASQTANDFTNTLKSKLDNIEANADVTDAANVLTSLPSGVVSGSSQISGVTSSQLAGSIANAKLSNSSITINGSAVALGGSVTTPNDNDNTQLSNEQVQDIVGGMLGGTETGITVTYQDSTGDIDFVVASQTANDFTNTLKSKLDGIESSATADQSASDIRTLLGTGNSGVVPAAGSSGEFLKHDGTFGTPSYTTNTDTNTQLSDAEVRTAVEAASDSNVFTDADHTKLNGIASSANNYSHPTHDGDDISLDTSNAQVIDTLTVTTDGLGHVTDASVSTRDLTPTNIGLGNVDNTADSAKPVSTAQQTALDLKANLASPTFSGNPTAPTQAGSNSSTRIASTAFVQGRIDDIIGTAGSTLDTLGELSASLASDQSGLASLTTTVGTKLAKSSNLSDLANAATARTNLGLAGGSAGEFLKHDGTFGTPSYTTNTDTDTNTQNTYSTSVVSSSGIKLRLSGAGHDGSTTDDVKFVGAGGATVSRTDASTITITTTDNNTQNSKGDLGLDTDDDVTFGSVRVDDATASTSKTTGALIVDGGAGIAGALNVGGDVVAYASSDERLKDNIELISNPIEKVQSLKGVTWNWNDNADELQQSLPNVGVIAQDVEKVLPELVTDRDNGYKGVDYAKLTGLLIEAIKEQQKEIDSLKEKLK